MSTLAAGHVTGGARTQRAVLERGTAVHGTCMSAQLPTSRHTSRAKPATGQSGPPHSTSSSTAGPVPPGHPATSAHLLHLA
jgi:hypothetical protein